MRQVPSRLRNCRMASISSGDCFLLSDHVIEAEDHECVGVCEDALVDRQSLASLVDALEDGDGLCGGFADELLEAQCREVEEFKRAGDALQEHPV